MAAAVELPKPILSDEFYTALRDAGVVRDLDSCTRIVIDAQQREPVRLYVERWGDERLLNVATALNGIEITSAPAGQS